MVPKNEPKLLPASPMRSPWISARAASQSTTAPPVATHAPMVKKISSTGLSYCPGPSSASTAMARDRLEGGRRVGELRDALANRGEVRVGLGPARRGEVDGPRLVPIHAHGADRVVDQPALLDPAASRRSAGGGRGRSARRSDAGL